MNKKRRWNGWLTLAFAVLLALFIAACGQVSAFSTVTNEETGGIDVTAENAGKDTATVSYITIGEGECLVISPNLTQGSLEVRASLMVREATENDLGTADELSLEETIEGKVMTAYALEPGEYAVGIACAEKTTGTAQIMPCSVEELQAQNAALAAGLADTPFAAEEQIGHETVTEDGVILSDDASDFVLLSEAVPDAILEIRYYSTYNFVGDRIDGYEEPLAFLTKEAAAALKEVSDELVTMGYRLKIFDAYRPQRAVTHFMNWALDADDTRMKEYFYPELEKDVLFPQGYIAEHSGHSRGSTVDLTLFDMTTEKEVDMGGTFDYFGELSHPDYTGITEEQYANRMILRDVMLKHGFKPLAEEWWHFTLADEPYPDTYFTFPINSDSVQ